MIPLCPACRDQIRGHPQPVPGYRVVRALGRGGLGVVYLALRAVDGSLIALKTIKPAVAAPRGDIDRFLRDARTLNELVHPNLVEFHEMGETNGLLHFAMDYVAGVDAAQLQTQLPGPLPTARAVDLVCQVLQALDYTHAKGFVHCAIKPANMLVTKSGGRELVKLTDFGLARVYKASKMSGLTMNGDLGGTAAFLAPEQISEIRTASPMVDQYSTAATLYKLLTDRYIYDLPNRLEQQVMKILLVDPVPIRERRPDLPEPLAEIIHRALARDPQARFASVREMRRALAPFAT